MICVMKELFDIKVNDFVIINKLLFCICIKIDFVCYKDFFDKNFIFKY